MTARKTQADKSEEKDAEQAAEKHNAEANRGQKDFETTEQAADREVPTKPEEIEASNDKEELVEEFETVDNGLGVVAAPSLDGKEYDVPWAYLTAADVEDALEVRTSDSDDPARSWTNQDTLDDDETPVALVPVQQTPGQTFLVRELPDVKEMEKAGVNVAQFLSGLPVRAEAPNEAPRKGIPA